MTATLAEQDHDTAWFELIEEVRRTAKRLEQAERRDDHPAAKRLRSHLQRLGDQVVYAYQRWERYGGWTRYYQVRGGVVHTSLACRTVGLHTVIRLMPELSAKPISEVAGQHRMCRHCGDKETHQLVRQASSGELKRQYFQL